MSSDVAAQSRCHSTSATASRISCWENACQSTEGAEFFGHGQVDFGIRAATAGDGADPGGTVLATEFENRFEAFFLRITSR